MNAPRTPHRDAYLEAADRATEDHPLPGEDVESWDPDDIQLWIATYAELLRFKEAVIATAMEQAAALTDTAREEVSETDLRILTAERGRFQRRIRFWEGRRDAAVGG